MAGAFQDSVLTSLLSGLVGSWPSIPQQAQILFFSRAFADLLCGPVCLSVCGLGTELSQSEHPLPGLNLHTPSFGATLPTLGPHLGLGYLFLCPTFPLLAGSLFPNMLPVFTLYEDVLSLITICIFQGLSYPI